MVCAAPPTNTIALKPMKTHQKKEHFILQILFHIVTSLENNKSKKIVLFSLELLNQSL